MFSNAKNANPLHAVNFHLWQPCNMRCHFCFATFQDVKQSCLPKGHLPRAEAIMVVKALCEAGAGKITFAGGEPTLCPWLPDLLKVTKSYGVTTMIVTNGSRLTPEWLNDYHSHIDWIALSVDSLNLDVNFHAGRKEPGRLAPDLSWYLSTAQLIKSAGIRFKVNTVVNRLNAEEDLSGFIASSQPERWKLFQVLPIKGQNDGKVDDLLLLPGQFDSFVERHRQLLPDTTIVAESNEDMTGSYLMVDPAGRFFDNVDGRHFYSKEILMVGIFEALKDIRFDRAKFLQRDGLYDWGVSI